MYMLHRREHSCDDKSHLNNHTKKSHNVNGYGKTTITAQVQHLKLRLTKQDEERSTEAISSPKQHCHGLKISGNNIDKSVRSQHETMKL